MTQMNKIKAVFLIVLFSLSSFAFSDTPKPLVQTPTLKRKIKIKVGVYTSRTILYHGIGEVSITSDLGNQKGTIPANPMDVYFEFNDYTGDAQIMSLTGWLSGWDMPNAWTEHLGLPILFWGQDTITIPKCNSSRPVTLTVVTNLCLVERGYNFTFPSKEIPH
jgi:hypothetical protein